MIRYAAAEPGTPPTVSLSSPADGASYRLGDPIRLAATASDADGSVSRVEFYWGLTRLGQDTTAPYEYTWSAAPVGNHTLTAVAFDNTGASTTSAAVVVTVSQGPAGEQVVTLQDGLDGYGGTRDAYLYEPHPSTSYGAAENLADRSASPRLRSLVRFAIFNSEGGPVPDGATITSATLGLYKYSYYNYDYRLRALLTSWVESEVTWGQARRRRAVGRRRRDRDRQRPRRRRPTPPARRHSSRAGSSSTSPARVQSDRRRPRQPRLAARGRRRQRQQQGVPQQRVRRRPVAAAQTGDPLPITVAFANTVQRPRWTAD